MENQSLDSMNMKQDLPNSTTILVLGILSIVTCWCIGIVGLGIGITALFLAGKAIKIYNLSPHSYTESSLGNMKAGKICAIIGVCLSSFMIIYFIIYFLVIGLVMSNIPWEEIFNKTY